ncbi:O-antigen ligase family protein [Phenylobacterium sp.]|uniref:O-antigen ligase family protein n=1 Tax=Phenylobacterium sp. TaxID=1871053 RepID=UPI002F422081
MSAKAGAPVLRSSSWSVEAWCGWVLVGAAPLVPVVGYLAPLGLAALVSLVGLLCLPALRIADEDRPAAIILFAALIWAAVSTTWSPYHPGKVGNMTIVKLALELPLFWSAVSAGRRADPALRTRALRVVAWGCALFGVVLIVEAATHAVIYKALHRLYQPIRDDLAESNVGHATQVLGLIWPLAAVSAAPRLRAWFALAMFVGTGAAALAFGYDSSMLGLVLAPLAAAVAWRWPRGGPRAMALATAALFLATPFAVWAVRHFLDYEAIRSSLPRTDSMRLGYWSHAIDWIGDRPLRGWGLDASRMFGPGIILHPHNNPLQIWLELGAVGAVAAAAFWGVTLGRLARPEPSLAIAATIACAMAYLLFGVNFGIWQDWWLALGVLVAMLSVMNVAEEAGRRTAQGRIA